MTTNTRSGLLARALQVRDETLPEANSAARVGQLLYDLVLQSLLGYDPTASYAVGDAVFFQGIAYRALAAVPPGKTPPTFPLLWSDDIARQPGQIDRSAPDRLVSQRAIAGYVTEQLALNGQNGGTNTVPAATETTPGLVRRAGRANASSTNYTDYMTPALVLELIGQYLTAVTLDQAARAGNETSVRLVTNGGISAQGWPVADTADRVFVPKLIDGQLHLALLDKAKLTVAAVPGTPSTPGTGPATLEWEPGDLWEEVLATVTDTLLWEPGDLWEEVTITTPTTAPLAPTQVQATRVANTRNAVLSWRDNADNETGYDVEVKTDSGPFVALLSVAANVTVLPLSGLALLMPYSYRVRAKNDAGTSAWSVPSTLLLVDYLVTAHLYGTGNPPPLIRQLLAGSTSASPGRGNIGALITNPGGGAPVATDYDQMTLAVVQPDGTRRGWDTPALQATGDPYFAYPRPDGGVLPAGAYAVEVGLWKNGQLIQSERLTHTLTPFLTPPAAPTGLTARRNADQTGIVLTWVDNSDNEDTFVIDWQRPGQNRAYLTSALANAVSLTSLISPLPDGTIFWVAARNGQGTSPYVEATLPVTTRARQIIECRIRWVSTATPGRVTVELEVLTRAPAPVQLLVYVSAAEPVGGFYPLESFANGSSGQTLRGTYDLINFQVVGFYSHVQARPADPTGVYDPFETTPVLRIPNITSNWTRFGAA